MRSAIDSGITRTGHVYATLMVVDGERQLSPAQFGYDRLCFTTPPRLTSEQVEIILRNGEHEQRHIAAVLTHSPDATQIPIKLISND